MRIFTKKHQLSEYLDSERINKKSIGFVPTMGALHDGHLELVRNSVKENDINVCSIFVNPTQFNNQLDLKNYPRNPEKDCLMLEKVFCDVVFIPDKNEIYGEKQYPETSINFGEIESILEGKFRPGHFKGVGIIVAKLLNIVKPNHVYFGQKDLQQYVIVSRLIRDLSYDIGIRCIPTVREKNGLAMSSRNSRLDPEDRNIASFLYQSLNKAKVDLLQKIPYAKVKKNTVDYLAKQPQIKLEYLEMVDADSFKIIEEIKQGINPAICIAALVGNIRLIDNIFI